MEGIGGVRQEGKPSECVRVDTPGGESCEKESCEGGGTRSVMGTKERYLDKLTDEH